MRSSNGLSGLTAVGLLLLWGAVANAQPPGAPKSSATPQHASSTAMSSLICDSSGKVCIAVGQRAIAESHISGGPSSKLNSVPFAAVSKAASGAHELPRSKQQAVTTAHAQLICDWSGKVCTSAQAVMPAAPRDSSSMDNGAALKRKGTGSANPKPAPMTAALARQSPKKNASSRQLSEPGYPDHAAIDGAGVYDSLASDDPFSWVVHVYKSRHRLEVYFKGHLYKTYHAVFGRSLDGGAKMWEGDRRTPEGNYLIVAKHRSARFGWFLRLNYPNERDHERFEQSLAAHLIPASAQEGGQIGIHGTDSPYLNVAEVDWTTGCISVDNGDISELARLLPVGTLVIINP